MISSWGPLGSARTRFSESSAATPFTALRYTFGLLRSNPRDFAVIGCLVFSLTVFSLIIPLGVFLIYPHLLGGVFQHNEKVRTGQAPRPPEMFRDARHHFRPVLKGFAAESVLISLTLVPIGAVILVLLTLDRLAQPAMLGVAYGLLTVALVIVASLQFYSIGIVRHNIPPLTSLKYSVDLFRENTLAIGVYSIVRVLVPLSVAAVFFAAGGFLLQYAPEVGLSLVPVFVLLPLLFWAAFHYTFHSEFYRLIAPEDE